MKTETLTIRPSLSKANAFLIRGLFIALILFAQQSLSAQDSKQELRAKEKISKLVQEVKAIEDVSKKEKALEKAVAKFDKRLQRAKKQDLTAEELQQLDEISNSLNSAFAQVRGKGHEDLNEFADYFESEANQAMGVAGMVLIPFAFVALIIIIVTSTSS